VTITLGSVQAQVTRWGVSIDLPRCGGWITWGPLPGERRPSVSRIRGKYYRTMLLVGWEWFVECVRY
jgi:hypothetical protein